MSGTSACVRITKPELEINGLDVGDVVHIEITTQKEIDEKAKERSSLGATGGIGGYVKSAEEEESDIKMFENYLKNMGKSEDRKKRLKEVLKKIDQRRKELKV